MLGQLFPRNKTANIGLSLNSDPSCITFKRCPHPIHSNEWTVVEALVRVGSTVASLISRPQMQPGWSRSPVDIARFTLAMVPPIWAVNLGLSVL